MLYSVTEFRSIAATSRQTVRRPNRPIRASRALRRRYQTTWSVRTRCPTFGPRQRPRVHGSRPGQPALKKPALIKFRPLARLQSIPAPSLLSVESSPPCGASGVQTPAASAGNKASETPRLHPGPGSRRSGVGTYPFGGGGVAGLAQDRHVVHHGLDLTFEIAQRRVAIDRFLIQGNTSG